MTYSNIRYQVKRIVTHRFSSSVSDKGRGVSHHHVVVGVLKNMSATEKRKIQTEKETGGTHDKWRSVGHGSVSVSVKLGTGLDMSAMLAGGETPLLRTLKRS